MEHLREPSVAAHYLNAALEESDDVFAAALEGVAAAHAIPASVQEFENLMTVLRASGLKLTIGETAPAVR